MEPADIAPCGINCSLCSGYLREKNPCPGCNGTGDKPTYCASCGIRFCAEKAAESEPCGTCGKYPCARLKRLQKRYALKYGVDVYENLALIRGEGMDAFIGLEGEKWACPACGGPLCMHKDACPACGAPNPNFGPAKPFKKNESR